MNVIKMSIEANHIVRSYQRQYPSDMWDAIREAAEQGFRQGVMIERTRRSEEDRILGNIGLTRAEFLKYQPQKEG